MRYARSKQLALYVYQGSTERYKEFKKLRGSMGNLKIDENVILSPYCNALDITFKWERKMNRVQWSYVNRTTHTTRFALLKYPVGVKK
ncbi:hypothetical protein COF42_17260 [Bacillus wiedmannii]|uniref:hypothetical protein n=1 Tax=Bacillus wiedmannii TaxID=1890302 RepID=UPI000BFC0155|nr:hypothetical protein [Bacillus wiedmannii]PHC86060.1 hypothetical protein COF42_17260 [Bacillus wiedmannii]